jgi:hypothetical protein
MDCRLPPELGGDLEEVTVDIIYIYIYIYIYPHLPPELEGDLEEVAVDGDVEGHALGHDGLELAKRPVQHTAAYIYIYIYLYIYIYIYYTYGRSSTPEHPSCMHIVLKD